MADHEEEPMVKIGDLNSFSRRVYTVAKVISKNEVREVTSRTDNSSHRVSEALVADDTGSILLTLWDDAIDAITEDSILKLNNAYVNVFKGSMRLNLGRYGSYEEQDEDPFEDVNLDNNISDKQVEYTRRSYGRGDRDRGRGRRY
ncbi:MAG: hypothetical protein NWE89_08565 [Candidatus Bathyarchaeota archaeon]|nr:hypothetical protein [Candidatus Bathyarchaeota archaeon]